MQAGNSELVEILDQFFRNYYDNEIEQLAQRYPNGQRSLSIDWRDIHRFDRDLADDYLNQPEQLQRYAEEALRLYDVSSAVSLGQAHVRVHNLPETERPSIGDVRSRHINCLIEITGTIDSVEQAQSTLKEAAFECQLCGTLNRVPQSAPGDLQEPHECMGCERSGPFRVNHDQSEYIDTQTIYVEQRPPGVGTDDDREIIMIRLEDDLVDKVVPGDTVNISGVVRRDAGLDNSTVSIPDKYIEAVAITEASRYQLELTDADKEKIVRLSSSDSIYETMVDSIAPTVYGYEREKLALALQLFSGVRKQLPDGSKIRGDIHIAMLGDPGIGKSKLARYAARVAPRSVHVSGTNTTQVGLTAAAKRTSNSNNTWTFEAGALPKAHHGVCCVDNITDLRSEELRALHDVLEEQVVEPSKGSSTVSIPAKASLLAVGNPKYGRFDQYEPIAEQLGLEPGLLSQFDLLFVMTDSPGEEQDENVADHVLQTNYAGQLNTQTSKVPTLDVSEEEIENQLNKISPEIDPELLQKYIAYSRLNCHPRLTDGARERIKEFYIEIRSVGVDEDQPVPVSARKLEGLVRLSEASARIRLSDTVEEHDANRVINLVRSCFNDIGIEPEQRGFDADVVDEGASKSDQDWSDMMKELVSDVEEEYGKGAPTEAVLEQASEVGMDKQKVERELDKLKQKGEVYEPSTDVLRTT